MEAKHTPGPWQDTADAAHGGAPTKAIVAPDGVRVARAYSPGRFGVPQDAERDANARLIAAAPDMLAALRDVSVHLAEMASDDPRGQDAAVLSLARAAIAKATGAGGGA